jgi:putative DNA primase/helicase
MTTLEWARYYANLGFSVLPLLPRQKIPAISSWRQLQHKRPCDWEIKLWFDAVPDANLGIITGAISGLFVVDYDVQEAAPCPGDYDVVSSTGRGSHFLYRWPDFTVNNRAGIKPGVDVRGEGGYIVAAPSIHPTGARYAWSMPQRALAHLPQAPEDILSLLRPRTQRAVPTLPPSAGAQYWARVALENEWDNVLKAPEGQRNNSLNRAAYNMGQLVGDSLLERSHVEIVLTEAARAKGMSEYEIERTIRSGMEAGIINPRSLRARRGARA